MGAVCCKKRPKKGKKRNKQTPYPLPLDSAHSPQNSQNRKQKTLSTHINHSQNQNQIEMLLSPKHNHEHENLDLNFSISEPKKFLTSSGQQTNDELLEAYIVQRQSEFSHLFKFFEKIQKQVLEDRKPDMKSIGVQVEKRDLSSLEIPSRLTQKQKDMKLNISNVPSLMQSRFFQESEKESFVDIKETPGFKPMELRESKLYRNDSQRKIDKYLKDSQLSSDDDDDEVAG